MQKIKITNSQSSATIDIEGTIGVPEEWQFDEPQQRVATYERFRRSLQEIEELKTPEVIVNIRSTGGDVNDALLIYDALSALDASITTRCWGYVASAATVIAQAASEGKREISANSLYLIHNAQSAVEGSAQELAQRVELLRKTDQQLAELYARRSGGEVATFQTLMQEEGGAGRWLNAREAIELGLADREIDAPAETQSGDEESVIAQALNHARGLIGKISNRLGVVTKADADTEPKSSEKREAEESPEQSIERRASMIAMNEGQARVAKSQIKPCNDPSLADVQRSANQDAYARDAQRLR